MRESPRAARVLAAWRGLGCGEPSMWRRQGPGCWGCRVLAALQRGCCFDVCASGVGQGICWCVMPKEQVFTTLAGAHMHTRAQGWSCLPVGQSRHDTPVWVTRQGWAKGSSQFECSVCICFRQPVGAAVGCRSCACCADIRLQVALLHFAFLQCECRPWTALPLEC